MPETVTFNKKDYTKDTLNEMSVGDLLELRNLIASNLGVASVKSFKDHDDAVEKTWKALERFHQTAEDEANNPDPATEEKKTKARNSDQADDGKIAKSAQAQTVKRPTRKDFTKIVKSGEHDGTQGRSKRWPNYDDEMLLIDVKEREGCEPWDVFNWQKKGIMTLTEPTDEEYAQRRAAWYKAKGIEDPEIAKEREAAAKAEEKAKREAEKEEKRKAAAEAKAKKDAEAKAEEKSE